MDNEVEQFYTRRKPLLEAAEKFIRLNITKLARDRETLDDFMERFGDDVNGLSPVEFQMFQAHWIEYGKDIVAWLQQYTNTRKAFWVYVPKLQRFIPLYSDKKNIMEDPDSQIQYVLNLSQE